jgi:hypothetical protein
VYDEPARHPRKWSSSLAATVSPTDFVTAHAADAHSVVVAVQEVQGPPRSCRTIPAVAIRSRFASFDEILSDAQSTFDKVNKVLPDAPKLKGVESGETEMWSATDELSSAMKYGPCPQPGELVR